MQDVLEPANAQSVRDEASRNDDNGRNEKTRVVVAVVVGLAAIAEAPEPDHPEDAEQDDHRKQLDQRKAGFMTNID